MTNMKEALWDKFYTAAPRQAVRRAIQHRQERIRTLASRYGINPKTVAKWKKRQSVNDLPTGPKHPHSSVLSIEEEAIMVRYHLAKNPHTPPEILAKLASDKEDSIRRG